MFVYFFFDLFAFFAGVFFALGFAGAALPAAAAFSPLGSSLVFTHLSRSFLYNLARCSVMDD